MPDNRKKITHSKPRATEEDIRCVVAALREGRFAQGEEVAALERELCAFFGRKEAVVVSSGTAALFLSLIALGLEKNDPVVIPSFTCQSLYSAVSHAGGTPLCADAGRDNVCVTADTIMPLLGKKPRIVIVPHMFGYCADIDGIRKLGVPVIEDCAQSAGGVYQDGSMLGSKGDISVFSFYATKLIPAGEGGACLTDSSETARAIRALRNSDEQQLNRWAFNFKMPDINAALARSKLKALVGNLEERARIAERYDSVFAEKSFRLRYQAFQPVCFRYLLELDLPVDDVLKKSLDAGIDCRKPVWRPLHTELGGVCPVTESLYKSLISVPVYPGIGSDADRICGELPFILGVSD